MKVVRFAGAFRKDLKRATRRGYRLDDLDMLITRIRRGERLPTSARPHPLMGGWKSNWECHVAAERLLINRVTDEEVLLARTGTHADLFAQKVTPNGSRAFHFAVAQQDRRSASRRTGHYAL